MIQRCFHENQGFYHQTRKMTSALKSSSRPLLAHHKHKFDCQILSPLNWNLVNYQNSTKKLAKLEKFIQKPETETTLKIEEPKEHKTIKLFSSSVPHFSQRPNMGREGELMRRQETYWVKATQTLMINYQKHPRNTINH